MDKKHQILKDFFGHSEFRAGQERAADRLLGGGDLLAVMPTGAGKSVCYQLPAMMLDGVTIVISPLISLMKDQTMNLRQNGIPAAFINSSLSSGETVMTFRMAEAGEYKLIFVAPERLADKNFLNLISRLKISLVIVDEAHCVSQWGQDFRPSYLHIPEFVEALPTRPAVGAFTATATEEVRGDIVNRLRLKDPDIIVTGFDRANLYYEVIKPPSREKDKTLLSYLKKFSDKCGIIYCSTRKETDRVYELCTANGISAAIYHAGLADSEREKNQEDFIYGRVRVMAATNAFGMGIDKSDVGFVIHFNMPKSPEAYYQEAGRAGRDGSRAYCVLFYSDKDIQTALYFIDNIENSELTRGELTQLKRRERKRLDAMIGYCCANTCLREYLLRYFGEKTDENFHCSGCSNCSAEFYNVNITEDAQKIISCVFRLEQRNASLGANGVIDILKGGAGEKLLRRGFNTLSTYGIMKNRKKDEIKEIIEFLISKGYLYRDDGEFPLLKISPEGRAAVKNREEIFMRRRVQNGRSELSPPREVKNSKDGSAELFERLKETRLAVAKRRGIPAYMVFSNAALEEMAALRPHSREEFLHINGVGEMKLEQYGEIFLREIKGFESKNDD